MKIQWSSTLLTLALYAAPFAVQAQSVADTLPNPYRLHANTGREKLYFLPGSGFVETTSGKRIFNRSMAMQLSDYDVPEVELPNTFFDLVDTSRAAAADDAMHYRYNLCTFNARGDLLYHTFWYDNGPDYWVEGRRRFVEGGRMGMVDRMGRRVVPARDYAFIWPMQHGFALACRDCRYTITDSADPEHGYSYTGTQYEMLDANGHIAARLPPGASPAGAPLMPRRHRDPKAVARLAALLYALPETNTAATYREMTKPEMSYVCYDEPDQTSPWYHFGLEDTSGTMLWPDVQFLVSADGKKIEFINHTLNRSTPYAMWHLWKEKFE